MSRPIRRRAVLAVVGAAAAGTLACSPRGPRELRLAAGEPGGFYAEFGALLVEATRGSGAPLRASSTGGSRANVELVARGGADLALVLADVVVAARSGEPPFRDRVDLLAVGRVYQNYLQLAVRAASPFLGLADLAGRRISIGAPGSGAAIAGARLLAVSRVEVRTRELDLIAATRALETGAIDAFLWSGGVPTPAVGELAARTPIRLLPLGTHLRPLTERFGVGSYVEAVVPPSIYGARSPVPTIGVANLLVATAAVADQDVGAVTRVLVRRASRLVPASALGTQFLDRSSLIDTGDVPLHPGAVAAYRDLHG